MGKLKKFVLFWKDKSDYWFIIVLIFSILEILNCSFLEQLIPQWGCTIITIVLSILFTAYVGIIYKTFKSRYKNHTEIIHTDIVNKIKQLEKHICELNEQQMKLEKELAHSLNENIIEKITVTDEKNESNIHSATNLIAENVMSTKNTLITTFENGTAKIVEQAEQQYIENVKRDNEHFTNINNQFLKQNKEQKNQAEEQKHDIQQATNKLATAIQILDDHTSQMTTDLSNKIDAFDEKHTAHTSQMLTDLNNKIDAFDEKHTTHTSQVSTDLRDKLEQMTSESNSHNEDLKLALYESKDKISNLLENKSSRDEEIHNQSVELLGQVGDSIQTALDSAKGTLQTDIRTLIEASDEKHTAHTSQMASDLSNKIDAFDEKHIAHTRQIATDLRDKLEQMTSESNSYNEDLKLALYESKDKISNLLENKSSRDEEIHNHSVELLGQVGDSIKTALDSAKGTLQTDINETKSSISQEIKEAAMEDSKNTNTVNMAIQSLSDTIQQEVKVESESCRNHYKSVSQNVIKLQEAISAGDDHIEEKIKESTTRLEEIVTREGLDIKQISKQLLNGLEKNIADKINEAVVAESQILECIVNENKAIQTLHITLDKTNSNISEMNKKLQNEFQQKTKIISEQIFDSIEKTETFNSNNKERFDQLTEIIRQNEKNTIAKTDTLGVKTADLQVTLTKLITQVLDNIEDSYEKADASYNRIFNQISGFSNSMKVSLDKLILELNTQKQAFERETEFYKASSDNQSDQSNTIRKELIKNTHTIQVYQMELKSRIENLQNQITALNSLSEVLKNRNVSSLSTNKQGTAVEKAKANRVEKIVDKETGITVHNHYKNNMLVFSEMLTNNKKTYDAEYDNSGQITRTRNYGQDGSIITELQFYSNGQVKTRTEMINVNGTIKKVTTQFDKQGNKK